jgi:glycine/D-amino acid oxidase-like deaminating enzyme
LSLFFDHRQTLDSFHIFVHCIKIYIFLVPGAAMHIISQRNTIGQIIKDYFGVKQPAAVFSRSLNEEDNDFSKVPPYFGFSMNRCLGFLLFVYHFLKTSLFSTKHDVKLRGTYLVQLANANRFSLSKELDATGQSKKKDQLVKSLSIGTGFISVHRTNEKAEGAVIEALEFGEEAELLTYENAVKLEPRIEFLPFKKNAYFVHRPNDQTGNCYEFMLSSIKSLIENGIKYENNHGCVVDIERKDSDDGSGHFRVTTSHCCYEYDYLILANGVYTPLLARKLASHASHACPTYPLKGYSMTLYNDVIEPKTPNGNFLKKAMSFDNLYCTSVGHNMVRLAGFGELTGFPTNVDDYRKAPAVASNVMQKYARAIFGNDFNCQPELVTPCFRPLSPDDLPLVGEVKSVPGLFLHTGHGTLGWTLGLATADCLAQSVCDAIQGHSDETDSFVLPDHSRIPKGVLSPSRFL